jgi:hypothetical protein
MKVKNKFLIYFSIAFFLFAVVILPGTNILPFSRYIWHSGTLYRYSMSKSLVKKVNNSKLNRTQIIDLLGQPDDSSAFKISYFLKSNNLILGLDCYFLRIQFTDAGTTVNLV